MPRPSISAPAANAALLERRVLILAPTGRDGPLTRELLCEHGIRCIVCADLPRLADELAQGAGALLVSEEAIARQEHLNYLGERLARQAPWSDIPVLLLARPGADSPPVRQTLRALGNVTLIERPVRIAALLTAVQTALRARQRQYNAREHLVELDCVAGALRDGESRLKALFDNAAIGIAEIDGSQRFALVNDSICRLLGTKREGLLDKSLSDVVHPDDRIDLYMRLADLFEAGCERVVTEARLVREDGAWIWAKLAASLSRVGDERGAHAVVAIEDVTEQKHAEEDLREADRRKDEFLAILAHELRNPLAPIRNSLHIFRMAGVQDPAVARVTEMMERQVAHMVRMVDDLLEVSRISRGKIELRRERVELASVLRSAVDTSLPLIEANRHKLAVQVPPEPLLLDADPVRLAQVFANLLNNSAKYTPPGGRIDVEVTVDNGMAVIGVRDNGEGIAPQMLSRVFNMFTQVNPGERAQGGLGIGLTLARTLVNMHGGSIEALSGGREHGCEFQVRLPLVSNAEVADQAQAGHEEKGELRLRRVLVVDDNEDAADSLGMLLEFLGAEVRVVHDGFAALEALSTFQPAAVLLDLGMPGMNGLEVARRMREDPRAKGALLVALTGWGQREDRRRTMEAGFDYHLVKPADLGTLQSILSMRELPDPDAAVTRH
ncbi:MAG TPA: ATP-binding protein [Usitatibacter sp.]|nr:ATP-binding protein [Usitatibacter sp.]